LNPFNESSALGIEIAILSTGITLDIPLPGHVVRSSMRTVLLQFSRAHLQELRLLSKLQRIIDCDKILKRTWEKQSDDHCQQIIGDGQKSLRALKLDEIQGETDVWDRYEEEIDTSEYGATYRKLCKYLSASLRPECPNNKDVLQKKLLLKSLHLAQNKSPSYSGLLPALNPSKDDEIRESNGTLQV
jgi:hypothetical protein